jgi:N-acetylneuraminic acid mutarotase
MIQTPQIKNHTSTLYENKLYIFGGYDGKKNHCNLRIFDTQENCWLKSLKPGGTPPQGRNGHTATLVSKFFLSF